MLNDVRFWQGLVIGLALGIFGSFIVGAVHAGMRRYETIRINDGSLIRTDVWTGKMIACSGIDCFELKVK